MKVYIAGPMTGIEHFNFPAFHAAAAELRAKGYDVVNPAEINTDQTGEWHACLRADIRELVTCDAIALLPGWINSKGARLEAYIAAELGMPQFVTCTLILDAPTPKTNPASLAGDPGRVTASTEKVCNEYANDISI